MSIEEIQAAMLILRFCLIGLVWLEKGVATMQAPKDLKSQESNEKVTSLSGPFELTVISKIFSWMKK